jgi:CBS domain containing-hemolysin-like protein
MPAPDNAHRGPSQERPRGTHFSAAALAALSIAGLSWLVKVVIGPVAGPVTTGFALLIAVFVLLLVAENVPRTSVLRSALRLGIVLGALSAWLVMRYA